MTESILVYLELDDVGHLSEHSLQLVSMAKEMEHPVYVCLISTGSPVESLQRLKVEMCFHYWLTEGAFFDARSYASYMEEVVKQLNPAIILVPSTPEGKSVAPYLAVRLKTGLTADCTQLTLGENGQLIQTRPAYGGNVIADIKTISRPQLSTIRKDTFIQSESLFSTTEALTEVRLIRPTFNSRGKLLRLTRQMTAESNQISLVVGNGLHEQRGIVLIENLAKVLNCQYYVTRALVDKGWFSADKQVGLSGKRLKSDVCLVFGASGSIQFLEGLKQVKQIIAFNTDPNAPIFSQSHQSFLVDMSVIIPELINDFSNH